MQIEDLPPVSENTESFIRHLEKFRGVDLVAVTCPSCNLQFTKTKSYFTSKFGPANFRKAVYCSSICARNCLITSKLIKCAQCGAARSIHPNQYARSKSGSVFCSRSCSAKHSNARRATGCRRSKFEVYAFCRLEEQFPDLMILPNDRTAIGLELDLYFPSLSMAIEINGVFHYMPIYGQRKLERITRNDQLKLERCRLKCIDLHTLDVSSCKNMNLAANMELYYSLIKDLVTEYLRRARDADVQAL